MNFVLNFFAIENVFILMSIWMNEKSLMKRHCLKKNNNNIAT